MDGLAIDGADDIAGMETGVVGGSTESDFTDGGRDGRVAKSASVGIVAGGHVDATSDAIVGNFEFQGDAGSGLHGDGLGLFPGGVLGAIDGNDLIADLETFGIVQLRGRKTGNDNGLREEAV